MMSEAEYLQTAAKMGLTPDVAAENWRAYSAKQAPPAPTSKRAQKQAQKQEQAPQKQAQKQAPQKQENPFAQAAPEPEPEQEQEPQAQLPQAQPLKVPGMDAKHPVRLSFYMTKSGEARFSLKEGDWGKLTPSFPLQSLPLVVAYLQHVEAEAFSFWGMDAKQQEQARQAAKAQLAKLLKQS